MSCCSRGAYTFRISGINSTVVGVMPQGLMSLGGIKVDLWEPVNAESKRYVELFIELPGFSGALNTIPVLSISICLPLGFGARL